MVLTFKETSFSNRYSLFFIEKSRAEEERKIEELNGKLEAAIAARQEAEAKAAHLEERLKASPAGPGGVLASNNPIIKSVRKINL